MSARHLARSTECLGRLFVAGVLSFDFDSQGELDQAANCFRSARLIRLVQSPSINSLFYFGVKTQSDGLTDARAGPTAPSLFSVIAY
jgi:hypothetical protein